MTIPLRVFLFCAHPLTLVQVAFMRPSHVPRLVMVRFLLLVLFLVMLPVCTLRLLLLRIALTVVPLLRVVLSLPSAWPIGLLLAMVRLA